MNFPKSHLTFNRSQRDGILMLTGLIVALSLSYFFVDFYESNLSIISSEEIVTLQAEIDSLKTIQKEESKPKVFPFNPNFITDFKAYTLGMSPQEYDRLKTFRSKNKWINTVPDFKRVTGVSDSLLENISPYFKFPEWITNPKPKKKAFSNQKNPLPYALKTDLNIATKLQLQQVYGIGEVLSQRIIVYRKKLGGFASDTQLYSVYGLNEAVVGRTLLRFTVKTPKVIYRMNINTASASDIATIPGISFELAKEIWEFRRLRERIEDLNELQKIEGISEQKFRLITLYLYTK